MLTLNSKGLKPNPEILYAFAMHPVFFPIMIPPAPGYFTKSSFMLVTSHIFFQYP